MSKDISKLSKLQKLVIESVRETMGNEWAGSGDLVNKAVVKGYIGSPDNLVKIANELVEKGYLLSTKVGIHQSTRYRVVGVKR